MRLLLVFISLFWCEYLCVVAEILFDNAAPDMVGHIVYALCYLSKILKILSFALKVLAEKL